LADTISPEFHLPTEIYIQQEISKNSAEIASKFGERVVIVTVYPDFEIYQKSLSVIYNYFKRIKIGCIIYDELPESPTTEDIDAAVSFIKKTGFDLIIGFGGIESINSAKAIALLTNNHIFCYDLLSTNEILKPPANFITMPAYPSFGFEITPMFYVKEIHNLTNQVYHNLKLYPLASIIDPELSLQIPADKILKTSTSALAVATESVISTMNNDVINTFALKAIDFTFRNLPVAYKEQKNIVPRTNLSTASIMAGISFSVAFLSISLAIALAISSKTDIDIETAISIILPHIMEFNLTTSPGKYVQMSKVMGEDVRDITVIEASIKAVEAVRKLLIDIDIPQRLSMYKINQSQFKDIAELAYSYPFINNTPRRISRSEIETILISAL